MRDGTLPQEIHDVAINNYRVARAVGVEFNFATVHFWQPHLALDDRSRLDDLDHFRARMDPGLVSLTRDVYRLVCETLESTGEGRCLHRTFADRDEVIWIDEWGHVTPLGNQLIADAISRSILDTQVISPQ